jgi:1-acyl-sn-glycerol-3-phosphate acyltransferase
LKKHLQNWIWHSGRFIFKKWFALTGQGRENLLSQQPYLIAANHVSHLDGPAIIAAHDKSLYHIYSLAASDYFFNNSLKSYIFRNLFNMIPFKRKGWFRDCLPICRELLNQNKIILIFPEGTRSKSGKLQTFKSGLGFLALELGVPIIPAYIHGTYEALPKGKIFHRRHPIQVAFGKPIHINTYLNQQEEVSNRQIYKQIIDDVRYAIERLQNQYIQE